MNKSLLVAEDDPGLRKYFMLILKQKGYEVHGAENGKEALSLLLEKKKFDLLITDINMPVMSGIELIKEINKSPINIPVSVITSIDDIRLIPTLRELGCSIILEKPVTSNELFNMVTNILSKEKKDGCLSSSA